MTQYYFLTTYLPSLQFGVPPDISFEELEILFDENLSSKDLKQVEVIRRYYDLFNMRAFWKGEPLDPHGNWNENQLEEVLLEPARQPEYLRKYLEEYESTAERVSQFSRLLAAYFRNEEEHAEGFLKKYLQLERELRLILVGFRAKKMKRDLLKELQYEDPEEPIVAQILAQKDDLAFHPPEPYEELKPIFEANADNPMTLHQALLEWRYGKIQEFVGVQPFSIDRILGYFVRFILNENSLELDKIKGTKIVDSIVEERS